MSADGAYLRLGLVGYPLARSLSPRLHQAALRSCGLAGEYRLYPVEPLPVGGAALAELVTRLRRGGLDGLNVTIPHKQALLDFVDDLSPEAAAIGAVNTLVVKGGRVMGANTDARGFLLDFSHLLAGRAGGGKRTLVLGAGGAARAVVYALLTQGWQVTVASRRLAQAERLAADFEGVESVALAPAALAVLGELDALVNTTPLGAEACPWPDSLSLPAGALVYDLVYAPPETQLLARAKSAGLAARGGLGMLVEQAALAFELWSGRPAPREAMWDNVNME